MYLIRRTYKTKPGEAYRVANLVQKQVQLYHDAGHRGEFRVAFNGGTCPGEPNTVVLEWTDSAFQSPMREGNDIPPEAREAGQAYRPYLEGTPVIEFMELLSPDKIRDM